MGTAAAVKVGVTGAIYGAPTGTTLPTSVSGSLNAAFLDLGYADENGIVQSINSQVTEIKAWQNADVVRKIQTSHDLTYSLTFLETSDEVLAAFFGDYTDGVVQVTGDEGVRQSWVFDVQDGGDTIRIVIPDGQITERGNVSFVNADAIKYPITISCFPDASGVKAYWYLLGAGS